MINPLKRNPAIRLEQSLKKLKIDDSQDLDIEEISEIKPKHAKKPSRKKKKNRNQSKK